MPAKPIDKMVDLLKNIQKNPLNYVSDGVVKDESQFLPLVDWLLSGDHLENMVAFLLIAEILFTKDVDTLVKMEQRVLHNKLMGM